MAFINKSTCFCLCPLSYWCVYCSVKCEALMDQYHEEVVKILA